MTNKLLLTTIALLAAACGRGPDNASEPVAQADAPVEATSEPAEATLDEPAVASLIVASGEVAWAPGAGLPEKAFLRVKLIDASRMDVAAETLTEEKLPVAGGPPVSFTLSTGAPIEPTARLSVSAQISDGVALYYTSDTNNPVSPIEGAPGLTITLVPVDASPGTGAGGMPVTPPPVAYLCAGEPVGIAIKAGAAFVAVDGGAPVKLDLLGAGDNPDALKNFTNGRMTVFFESEGPRVRLARGKAAAQDCTPAP